MWTNWLEWTFWPTMMDGIVLYINVKTDDKKENPANGKRYKINNIKTCMQQRGASLPHTQVNINDFPSVANNLLTECWDTGRVTWHVSRGCMTKCWAAAWHVHVGAWQSVRSPRLRAQNRFPCARGEHSARSRAWLQQALTGEQQQYLHTISTLSTAWAGPGLHLCIILEFTQNPDLSLRSGAGWTMDGTEDSWLVGWLWPGVEVCWNFYLHAGGDGGH